MKYLKVWTSFREVLEPLEDAEKGRLFDMMLLYADTGEEPGNIAGNERFTWPAAKQMLDLMKAENDRLSKNGKNGGRPSNGNQEKPTETNENQEKPTETNINKLFTNNHQHSFDAVKRHNIFASSKGECSSTR